MVGWNDAILGIAGSATRLLTGRARYGAYHGAVGLGGP